MCGLDPWHWELWCSLITEEKSLGEDAHSCGVCQGVTHHAQAGDTAQRRAYYGHMKPFLETLLTQGLGLIF